MSQEMGQNALCKLFVCEEQIIVEKKEKKIVANLFRGTDGNQIGNPYAAH